MKNNLLTILPLFIFLNTYGQTYIAGYQQAKEETLRSIPIEYIYKARNELKIAYQHTSHGTHVSRGLFGLQDYKAGDDTLFAITNNNPTANKLEFYDVALSSYADGDDDASDLSRNETAFIKATRNFLDDPDNAEINVIMWAWCNIAGHDIEINYLPGMDSLINEYGLGGTKIGPGTDQRVKPVHFIFMTGHGNEDRNVGSGRPKNQADLITSHCINNQQFCLDYFSIDAHDMNDNYWSDAGDNGQSAAYNIASGSTTGNFYIDFENSNDLGVDFYENKSSPGGSVTFGAHNTQHITANRKAYAMWWILARIAGWNGSSEEPDTEKPSTPSGVEANAVSGTQINLSWNASTDNIGVTSYSVFRNSTQITTTSNLNYSDINLTPETLYRYYIVANDDAGNNSDASSSVSETTDAEPDNEAPSAPTNLNAIVISSSQINLSWNASTDNVGVSNYSVFRNSTQITTTSNLNYSDINLTPETLYNYYIIANDDAGNSSDASSSVSETTDAEPDNEAPSAPTNLNAIVISSSQINLSWNASTDNVGVTSYSVFRNSTQITTTSNLNYSDINLTPETLYSYYIVANDDAGNNSDASSSVSETTDAEPDNEAPSAPTNLNAIVISSSQINLSWNASTDNVGVSNYSVFRNSTQIATTSDLSYSDINLTPETLYNYYIIANDDAGNSSDASSSVSETTDAEPDNEAPSAPTNLNAIVISSSQINLSWNASTDNVGVTSYSVFRNSTQITTTSNLNYSDINLTPETLYNYYIIANDGAGNSSDASSSVSETTDSENDTEAPSAPTNLNAIVISSSQINLSWDASSDNVGVTSYSVFRNSTQITTTSNLNYSDINLTPETLYNYYIIANDDAGNSSDASSSVSETTDSENDTEAPSPPTNLNAIVISSSQINLSWDASSDNVGVTSYSVFRNSTQITTTSNLNYSDINLTPETLYNYYIIANDDAGNSSDASSSVSETTDSENDTEAPSPPTNLNAIVISSSQINLSWDASSDNVGVTSYSVFRNSTQITTTSNLNYSDINLTPETLYSYYIIANDNAGNSSDPSSSVSETTDSENDIEAPSTPTSLRVIPVSNSQIYLTWKECTDNVDVSGYNIYRDGIKIKSVSKTLYFDVGLERGSTHEYQVQAFDKNGNESPLCSGVYGTTLVMLTSISETDDTPDLQVYPNPTIGEVSFVFSNHSDKFESINVFSVSGKLIHSYLLDGLGDEFIIDLSGKPGGLYFYQILSKERVISGQIYLLK